MLDQCYYFYYNNYCYLVGRDKYISVLNKRLDDKAPKDITGIVAKKVRRQGSPSTSVPPTNVPAWAVKVVDEGKFCIYCFILSPNNFY